MADGDQFHGSRVTADGATSRFSDHLAAARGDRDCYIAPPTKGQYSFQVIAHQVICQSMLVWLLDRSDLSDVDANFTSVVG